MPQTGVNPITRDGTAEEFTIRYFRVYDPSDLLLRHLCGSRIKIAWGIAIPWRLCTMYTNNIEINNTNDATAVLFMTLHHSDAIDFSMRFV